MLFLNKVILLSPGCAGQLSQGRLSTIPPPWKHCLLPLQQRLLSSNGVSQIIACGFIDLIFFGAYNHMKYVLCKEQSSRKLHLYKLYKYIKLAFSKSKNTRWITSSAMHIFTSLWMLLLPEMNSICMFRGLFTSLEWRSAFSFFAVQNWVIEAASFCPRSLNWPSGSDLLALRVMDSLNCQQK